MRLIDADKLKECYTGTNGFDDKASYASIKTMIDFQPTALDANKIVENLKESDMYIDQEQCITVEDAIEIVKGGGLNE